MENGAPIKVKFHSGEDIPLELHKVRIVQKLFLNPIDQRLKAMRNAGFNTFQLSTTDVFLDMLTDSGTNAMSDNQVSSMLRADDAYAGSQSFYRMEEAVQSLTSLFGEGALQGRSFLDIGCGSGLFSIAASRLGAVQVTGMDVDPISVSRRTARPWPRSSSASARSSTVRISRSSTSPDSSICSPE